MSEEEQIKVLMAKEIVEDICSYVDLQYTFKCKQILHTIIVSGDGLNRLHELPPDVRRVIKQKLREEIGV